MNKYAYAVAALAVAGVVFSAGMVVADDYYDDEEQWGAGGGGWFMYEGEDGMMYKDNFGFCLNPDNYSDSAFNLNAREMDVKVKAYQFDNMEFTYDDHNEKWTAEAWGWAYGAGLEWEFHLLVTDNGHRSMDYLWFEVTTEVDDEEVTLTWEVTGLGGGQIWVYYE